MQVGSSGGIRIGSSQPEQNKAIKEGEDNQKATKNQSLNSKSGMLLSFGAGIQALVRGSLIIEKGFLFGDSLRFIFRIFLGIIKLINRIMCNLQAISERALSSLLWKDK